jgi:hypothetical protein
MVYKLENRILYTRDVKLKTGLHRIYFFSSVTPKSGIPCDLPEGYSVGINKRTGFPYVKKKY